MAISEDRPTGRWLVRVSMLLVSQSTQNFTLAALALLLPVIQDDIRMSFSEAGVLSVVTTLAYAVMQVPAGYLGDRLGARRVMLFGLLGLNALTVLIAIAPGYIALAGLLAVIGAFRALAFAPGLALIISEFPSRRRATGMSLFMASGFAANLVLSIAAPPLLDSLGWRGIIGLFGAAGLIPVVVYWIVARRTAENAPPRSSNGSARFRALLREPVVWLSSVVQFTRLGITMALRFWLPTYLVTDKGFDLSTAALVVGVGSALTIGATLAGGHVSDRQQRPIPVIATSLLSLGIGLVLLTVVDEFVLVLLVAAGLYVFVQAYSGSLFDVPLRVLGPTSAGTLNGFGNGWANVGGLVTTALLGISKDVTASFDLGWLVLAGLCLVALVATIFLRRVLHGAERTATA